MTMNSNPSRSCAWERPQRDGRVDAFRFPHGVHESRRQPSPVHFSLAGSREPRTTDIFSMFTARQVPPIAVLGHLVRLASAAFGFARSESGVSDSADTSFAAQKALEGLLYEA